MWYRVGKGCCKVCNRTSQDGFAPLEGQVFRIDDGAEGVGARILFGPDDRRTLNPLAME